MHEYRRFIQSQLDERGWKPADLARKSGLSRQLLSDILNDGREHLGRMPNASTINAIADGFDIPVDLVRTAAARSLADYSDDGTALTITLSDVSTDALLNEIRRRIDDRTADQPASDADRPPASGTQGETREGEKNNVRDLRPDDSSRPTRRGRDFSKDPIVELPGAAYDGEGESESERARRLQDEQGEEPQE